VPGTGSAPVLATAPPAGARTAAESPAAVPGVSARRTLSGASLAGPIADRPVLSYRTPVYPDWAKRELVGGTVTLYFVVRPDGSVKENILVQQTAGFEDFDENARVALRAWKFAPLPNGRTGEQWGTITFRYKLQEAG
jgi:TonB family protein